MPEKPAAAASPGMAAVVPTAPRSRPVPAVIISGVAKEKGVAAPAAEPPAELAWKLLQFESRGRIPMGDEETFEEASWLAVFMGQHLQPRRYHPLADKFSLVDTRGRLDRTRAVMRQAAEAMPTHRDYLASRAPTRHSLP